MRQWCVSCRCLAFSNLNLLSSHFCHYSHVPMCVCVCVCMLYCSLPSSSLSLAPAVLRFNVQHGNVSRWGDGRHCTCTVLGLDHTCHNMHTTLTSMHSAKHTHTRSHSHTATLAYIHTHTHSHTHAHTHTHIHRHNISLECNTYSHVCVRIRTYTCKLHTYITLLLTCI